MLSHHQSKYQERLHDHQKSDSMRIHFLSDSLKTNSGFAIVTKNIALGLQKLEHIISMTGIQTATTPEYTYGIEQLPLATNIDEISQFQNNIMITNPDVVIYIREMYTDVSKLASVFPKTYCYSPIEGMGIPRYVVNNLNQIIKNGGKMIAQCQYGFDQMKKSDVNVSQYIYHGYNDQIFYPIDKSDLEKATKYCYYCTDQGKESIDPRILCKRGCYDCHINQHINQQNCPYYKEELITITKYINQQWTQIDDIPISKLPEQFKNRFVYLFIGQNHMIRKKIERLLEAYSILVSQSKQLKDHTHLHLHTNPISTTGLDLLDISNRLNIQDNISFSYGTWRSSGFSEQGLNILYNLADIQISATSSEGFGLPILEGFATGLPMISSNCTSQTELVNNNDNINENRGLLADIAERYMIDDGTYRELVNIQDLAIKMKDMYVNKSKREIFSKNAIKFANLYTWSKICDQWNQLLKDTK